MKTEKEISEVIFHAQLVATKRFLTYKEFAQYANCSKQYIRNLVHAGKLPTVQLWTNGSRFIDMAQITEKIDER